MRIAKTQKKIVLKKIILIILIILTFIINGCYPILQSAELAPPKKFTHTIRTGALVDDFFVTDDIFPQGFGYHLAYGVNDKLEINSDIDLFWPRTSFGVKVKLVEKLSLSANINYSFNYEDIFYYPDFNLIYGNKTYCGTRATLFIDGNYSDEMCQIFIGKKYRVSNRVNLIPEVALNFDGYLNIGFGIEFK
ncbi:MAG: hypothetical protein P9L97_00290 [Candidatus Tenebribacter davisii]|nr:hypothetical protein [Candidatus Tenebribacter davisii]